MLWMLAAILIICGLTTVSISLSSCEKANTIHHGENTGSVPVILYMFYLSQKDMPLAVQHPEIPLE